MRQLILAALLLICAQAADAREKVQLFCAKGGTTVTVPGGSAASPLKYIQSFPGATATIYRAGTTTLATVYSNMTGSALANPTTCDSTGYVVFYGDPGNYDVKLSGTGINTPFTRGDIPINTIVSVKDFGAACDGSTDDTTAFQAAIAAYSSGKVRFWVPASASGCLVTDSLTIGHDRVNFFGDGAQASWILFNPAVDNKVLFNFTAGASNLVQNSITDLGIWTTDTTHTKTAIRASDVSYLTLDNVAINGASGFTGATSIGIQLKGRDQIVMKRIAVYADVPLRFSDNPNSTIDIDQTVVRDATLSAIGNPSVVVDTGVNLSNVTFDGYQAWTSGTYGFYWNDTTSAGDSLNLKFENVRWEQGSTENGYAIYITHNSHLQNLVVNNLYSGLGIGSFNTNGIYLRNVQRPTISDWVYSGSIGAYPTSPTIALNANSTVLSLQLINAWFQTNAVFSVSGLTGFEYWDANNPGKLNFAIIDPFGATVSSPDTSAHIILKNAHYLDALTADSTTEKRLIGMNANNQVQLNPTGTTVTTINEGGAQAVQVGQNLPTSHGTVVVGNTKCFSGENAASSNDVCAVGIDSSNRVFIGQEGGDIRWGKANVGVGGGASATLSTIGGSGPGTAAQNSWMRIIGSDGITYWFPVWR